MISIRYPSQQQGYDPQAVDQSFDRAFTYGRERRDEKLATLADEKLRAALFGGGQPAQQPMSIAALAPQGYPGGVERAPLPDIASARVAQAHSGAQSPWPGAAPKQDRITPQDAARASMPPQGALEAYIRHAAQKRGIDPEIALKVAMSEGGVSDPYRQSDVVKNGVREQSYGPFQLYMNGGLGNEALAAGIDPRKDWKGGIDFALDKAAQGGWGPWMGAQKIGVTGRMGIGGGQQPMQVADASGGMPAPQGGPSGGNGLPDNETMRALFASPAHRPMAIELAKSAIAARQGDPEAALRLEKLSLEVEKLRNPASGGTEYGLSPIWGRDPATGEMVLGTMGKDGSFKRVDTGGVQLESGVDKVDLGTQWGLLNKRTGQIEGYMPKDLAGAAAATAGGKALGEDQALYESVSSKMPGLESVVKQLDALSEKATYTIGGQAVDWARTQAGMEPREAAIARAEYIATVDNQVLPMLRDVFGAAFTVKEGETLRSTLGDPDKSPKEKQAVLRAFIEQKRRDLEALATRSGRQPSAAQPGGNPYKDKYGLD